VNDRVRLFDVAFTVRVTDRDEATQTEEKVVSMVWATDPKSAAEVVGFALDHIADEVVKGKKTGPSHLQAEVPKKRGRPKKTLQDLDTLVHAGLLAERRKEEPLSQEEIRRRGYLSKALIEKIITLDDINRGNDEAWAKLEKVAPAGWFHDDAAMDAKIQNETRSYNGFVDPEATKVLPSEKNLSGLVTELEKRGVRVSLIELVAWTVTKRDVARAWVEQGGDMPEFLVAYVAKNPLTSVDEILLKPVVTELLDRHIEAQSALPLVQTCGQCSHFSRCTWLIGAKEDKTDCDWSPSRWSPIQSSPASAGVPGSITTASI
jgi:hypothetical protein